MTAWGELDILVFNYLKDNRDNKSIVTREVCPLISSKLVPSKFSEIIHKLEGKKYIKVYDKKYEMGATLSAFKFELN